MQPILGTPTDSELLRLLYKPVKVRYYDHFEGPEEWVINELYGVLRDYDSLYVFVHHEITHALESPSLTSDYSIRETDSIKNGVLREAIISITPLVEVSRFPRKKRRSRGRK